MGSKIKCLKDGPLFVQGDCPLIGTDGNKIENTGKVALCRCGHSSMKPLCDGAHAEAGFNDENESDPSKNKKRAYKGKKITVFYNRELCTHAARCVAGSPDVFNPKENPWIRPDTRDVEKLKETILKCPSGALSFKEEGEDEISDFGLSEEKIRVAKDGPYYVEGSIELEGVEFGEGSSCEHYSLCRCGKSGNKPFCDGYHHEIGFKAD